MTPQEMAQKARDAQQHSQYVTFIVPMATKVPKGFPRGELLCESLIRGEKFLAVRYDPSKILKWLTENNSLSEYQS